MTLHDYLFEIKDLQWEDWESKIISDCRIHWVPSYAILLKNTPQYHSWHPEFDVLLHTYLVMKGVCEKECYELLEASFMHDVGKIIKTHVGSAQINSFGHDKASVNEIESLLKDDFKYFKYPELTISITANHMTKNNRNNKYESFLNTFIWADKVRSSELFYELFDENFQLERKAKEQLTFKQYKNHKHNLIMLIGVSGSGKSTYIKEKFSPNIVVSTDDIRYELTGDVSDQSVNSQVWLEARVRLQRIINEYGTAVLDATNVNRGQRIEFMGGFMCKKTAIIFNVDLDTAINRVNNDILNGVNRSKVPEHVIRKQYNNFKRGLKNIESEFQEIFYVI